MKNVTICVSCVMMTFIMVYDKRLAKYVGSSVQREMFVRKKNDDQLYGKQSI